MATSGSKFGACWPDVLAIGSKVELRIARLLSFIQRQRKCRIILGGLQRGLVSLESFLLKYDSSTGTELSRSIELSLYQSGGM
jgi:hypothetical protein